MEENLLIPPQKVSPFSRYAQGAWEIAKIIIIAALIVLPIRYFLFQPFIVKGESMIPNFHENDYLIVDEISYRLGDPQRGDVVVLKYPLDATQRFIKRIVGLPGETVEIKDGKVFITTRIGELIALDESDYLASSVATTDGSAKLVLGEEKYFVLGDNRQFSYDSRRWGSLPKEDIVGKAVFRVFPLSDMSFVKDPTY